MKAIILAAGRGSRMGDLTKDSPKCLVKLRGKSLLDYQLTALNKAGITEIGIITGYEKDKIQDPRIAKKFENPYWEKSNMVRSLTFAAEWLNHYSCVISYSDIFYSDTAISTLMNSTDDIAITYDKNFMKLWSARFENPLADLESFQIDNNYILKEIGNRENTIDNIQGQYMGLLKFSPAGWQKIQSILNTHTESELDKLDITHLLKNVIQSNIPIKALPYSGIWGEVDHYSDLNLYESWDISSFA